MVEKQNDLNKIREYIINQIEVSILVIAASHRKNGHTQYLCKEAIDEAQQIPGVHVRFIELAKRHINPCRACEDKTGVRSCIQLKGEKPDFESCPATKDKDDMIEIWKNMLWCDGMIIGAGVYAATVPSVLKNVMERAVTGLKTRKFWLRDKVGGAFAVAAHIYGGQEFTIVTIENFYRIMGMIIVPDGPPTESDIKLRGHVIPSWSRQSIVWDRAHFCGATADPTRGSVKNDVVGISNVRGLGRRVALVSKWVKAGRLPMKMKIYRHFAKTESEGC